MTSKDIRKWNARWLADQNGSITAFADRLGKATTQVGQLIGANPIKNIGDKIARQIEEEYNLEEGELDKVQLAKWAQINRTDWKDEFATIANQYQVKSTEEPRLLSTEQKDLINAFELLPGEAQKHILAITKLLSGQVREGENPQNISISADDFQGDADELTTRIRTHETSEKTGTNN